MASSSAIKFGELVLLPELNPSSPYFKQGASLRVTGKLSLRLLEIVRKALSGHNLDHRVAFEASLLLFFLCTQVTLYKLLGITTRARFVTQGSWNLTLSQLPLRLENYSVDTAIATVADGSAKLKINTEHLREISFRVGSVYQFIGELLIQPDNEAVLQARVGRNVDGINMNLYHQSLQLLRQFQADRLKRSTT